MRKLSLIAALAVLVFTTGCASSNFDNFYSGTGSSNDDDFRFVNTNLYNAD